MDKRESDLLSGFGDLIGWHTAWLDVETFLRLAQHAAEAYFGGDEFDEYYQRYTQAFAASLKRAFESDSMAQDSGGVDSPDPAPGHAPGDVIEGAQ